MTNQTNSKKVQLQNVILSYPHLFAPHANSEGAEAKYSVTLLIPKDAKDVNDKPYDAKSIIEAAIEAATIEGVSKKWGGKRPPVVASPVHDGDGVRPNGEPFAEECKGHWVMTASTKQPPQVINRAGAAIVDQSEIYAGVIAGVTVEFFAYDNAGKRGVGAGLRNVIKLADGEPLAGRTSATDDFADLIAANPATDPWA